MTLFDEKIKAIIPARGGSKGIKRKNLQILGGLPLIAHPIMAALKSKHISDVYVSSDDTEILEISKKFGAKTIVRPSEYAGDNSLDIDVMRHAVSFLNDTSNIAHLRATSPLVTSEIIDRAVEYFLENKDCTSLRSCHECSETAYKFFKKNGKYLNGLFDNEFEGEYYNLPRQKLPITYQPNGCVDILKTSWFMNNDSLHGPKMLFFETEYMDDIDTIHDLKIMRILHGDKDKK